MARGDFRRLAQLAERSLAIHGALAVGQEGLPSNTLWIGDPLLVRFGVAARCVLGLDDRAFRMGEPVVDLRKLGLVFGLDAEMRNPGVAVPGADREIDAWVVEHPLRVV